MPTNVIINSLPENWSSAYDDIPVIFDFVGYSITGVDEQISGSVGTGKAEITISGTWDISPIVNQYVYIDSGTYLGLHKVLDSSSYTVVIDVNYTINQTTGVIKSLRIPTFQLYKGFKPVEIFPDRLPYTLVTQFVPIFNDNIQIEINLKGLLQSIFTIEPPDITTDYDFSVFNAWRLSWDVDNVTEIRYVLNSSIPTDELNELYVAGNRYLTNTEQPLLWGCGVSFMTLFYNGYPKLEIYGNGVQGVAGFGSAFQSNQFDQGYDI